MQDDKGYANTPAILCHFITFLASALPLRSVPTFIELVVGAMITRAGFVTEAWLAISPQRHWTAYYKWLQQGRWSWVKLGQQMTRLVVTFFRQQVCYLIIDDTVIFRSSSKAPDSAVHHLHGTRANRPRFVRGQCWVNLAFSLCRGDRSVAIPLLARLMRAGGNTSKLTAAKVLLRVVAPILDNRKVIVLLDSWYMRRTLICFLRKLNFQVIGQVRKDTALYELPPARTGRRGRPRIYGDKYTPEKVAALPEQRELVMLYGKEQWVRYRSALCLARFLHARMVRAVWVQLEEKDGTLTRQRLLLSTCCDITPREVIVSYARRWPIEDLFNQMKNRWGWKEAWQQTRQVLHRWTQILAIGFALPQLLTIVGGEQIEVMTGLTPWRGARSLTAGRIRLGLLRIFGHVRVRDWWNPKSRKFEPPKQPESPANERNGTEQRLFSISKSKSTRENMHPLHGQ